MTVKVQIAGRGNLDALTLPEQTAWHDFKSYTPTANLETTDALGLQGTKTFEQIVAPLSTDLKALPPLMFSYFDPETKTYRTLTHPAVPLTVHPGGSAPRRWWRPPRGPAMTLRPRRRTSCRSRPAWAA